MKIANIFFTKSICMNNLTTNMNYIRTNMKDLTICMVGIITSINYLTINMVYFTTYMKDLTFNMT